MPRLWASLACGWVALSLPLAAHSTAVVESAVGDVRVVAAQASKPAALQQNARVLSGSTLITGADGLVILKFDDEQKVMLAPNSEFTIVDSHYGANAASADRAEFALRRGALRAVSGIIAQRNVDMFVVRTPHVNLGVRGTDFSVTIIGQSYWSVNDGAVVASTNVGKGVFGKGSYGRSASLERLAAGVSSAGLPVAVLALFKEIDSAKVTAQLAPAPGGALAAAAPTVQAGAEAGGLGTGGMMAVLGAVAAALGAAGGGGESGNAAATTTHH